MSYFAESKRFPVSLLSEAVSVQLYNDYYITIEKIIPYNIVDLMIHVSKFKKEFS